MKILVTGSRNWTDRITMYQAIDETGADILIHGLAKGADWMARSIALEEGIIERGYAAKWDLYGRRAGPLRNQEMLDREHRPEEPIDLVLAFPLPSSIGTHDMIRRATQNGIPVRIIAPLEEHP